MNLNDKMISYTSLSDDLTFMGDVVDFDDETVSIDLKNEPGVATLPVEEGIIKIMGIIKKAERKAKMKAETKVKVAKPKKTRAPRGNGPSKKERALQIYRETIHFGKNNVIEAFMEQLSMSKAGATTYFYNCKKEA